ncbi:hypothetical protein KDJ56_07605 [Brevibacillus composti]|uniref:Uncharacterized protein n=1 Tax=Brevibacillus composti TaxID=2796470 RepID=A0A7T5ENG2_9BACL|nr:hypothetical protein [Brevibacillus composti]QQE75791.1 hypothetical protein JD108_07925 [Brevibacillus composti]QUO42817.1 hypothetical protein KDJ56_07605 [Brevibacillus composti]
MDDKLVPITNAAANGQVVERVKELYVRFLKEREKPLLDAVLASLALAPHVYESGVQELTPQMEEAFSLAFPHRDLDEVAGYDGEQLEGLLTAWKGKYFEVLVRDRLNSGETVGEIQLEDGQAAQLAADPTQAGWDLQIFNADGSVAQEIQLKATDSLSYIKEAIEKYPDIQVMSTDEVLDSTDPIVDQILSSGMNNAQITQDLTAAVTHIETPLEQLADALLPGLPFLVITVSEGRHVLMGRKTFELALVDALERSMKSGIAIGAGALVAFLDGGLLSIPTTILTRLGIDRYQLLGKASELVMNKSDQIIDLRRFYPPSP